MTIHAKGPPRGRAASPIDLAFPSGNDHQDSAPKTAPEQENILLEAIKALSADEIRAFALGNIPLTLAASGWRSAATMLKHAARCADAGDFLNAERNRQRARELVIEGNDAFRRFMEARSAEAHAKAFAEVFQ